MGPAPFVPLLGQEDNLGTLMLANPRGAPPFGESDKVVLRLLATAAAVALEYSRVRERLEQMMLVADRERIARDLHDGVIQALFALGMHVQQSALLTREPAVSRQPQENVATLDNVIRDLRGYIFGLRPGVLRELGLTRRCASWSNGSRGRAGSAPPWT